MSIYRHSDENRATPGGTPEDVRLLVERLRQRATRRKLFLLECAIIRHAPFAECGRTLWELMADQPWFSDRLPPIEWLKHEREAARRSERWQPDDRRWEFFRATAHDAIDWFERTADGEYDDDWQLLAQRYFQQAEWSAEAPLFEASADDRERLESSYGFAYWPWQLRDGPRHSNVLDHYLTAFPGRYMCWVMERPFHPGHRAVALDLIDDLLGHPPVFAPVSWQTSTVVGLAAGMYESRDFAAAPVLADALQDAGCDAAELLGHLRADRRHARGCWAVDAVLGKESSG